MAVARHTIRDSPYSCAHSVHFSHGARGEISSRFPRKSFGRGPGGSGMPSRRREDVKMRATPTAATVASARKMGDDDMGQMLTDGDCILAISLNDGQECVGGPRSPDHTDKHSVIVWAKGDRKPLRKCLTGTRGDNVRNRARWPDNGLIVTVVDSRLCAKTTVFALTGETFYNQRFTCWRVIDASASRYQSTQRRKGIRFSEAERCNDCFPENLGQAFR